MGIRSFSTIWSSVRSAAHFLLATLIFLIGATAFGIDCSNVRTCRESSVLVIGAGICHREVTEAHCGDFKSDKRIAPFLRTCTLKSICEERESRVDTSAYFSGCTGVTRVGLRNFMHAMYDVAADDHVCMDEMDNQCADTWLGAKAVQFFNLGVKVKNALGGAFVGAAHFGGKLGRGELHPVKFTENQLRQLQCVNNYGKAKLICGWAAEFAATVGVAKVARTAAADAIAEANMQRRLVRLPRREVIRDAYAAEGRGILPRGIVSKRATLKAPIALAAVPKPSGQSVVAVKEEGREKPPVKPRTLIVKPSREIERRREDYLHKMVGRQNTTADERQAFAELAIKTKAEAGTVFMDLQNSKMKFLNDNLGNKAIVTAVTNHRLQLTFKEIDALRSKYPQLATLSYDDFKSGRIAFQFKDGKVPKGFVDEVERIMDKAETTYINELASLEVVPAGSEILPPDKWFSVGFGCTGDQANVAARYCARTGQSSVRFWDPIVRKNLAGRLQRTDIYRTGSLKPLKDSGLTERLPNGELIPNDDVFEAYRKSDSAAKFAEVIEERTGVKLKPMQAQSLRHYLSNLDEWSTGLLIVKDRENVTFAGSKFNGATIDISGMGAMNLRELARALAGEKDVERAVVRSREAERVATETFEKNKAAIVKAAHDSLLNLGIETDVHVSGDDIIVIPLNREMDAAAFESMHAAIAGSSSTSNVRISSVGAGVGNADMVAVAGEGLEKKVRGMTLRSVPDQSRYTLMVIAEKGKPARLTVHARSGEVSEAADRAFQEAFAQVSRESKTGSK